MAVSCMWSGGAYIKKQIVSRVSPPNDGKNDGTDHACHNPCFGINANKLSEVQTCYYNAYIAYYTQLQPCARTVMYFMIYDAYSSAFDACAFTVARASAIGNELYVAAWCMRMCDRMHSA